KPVQEIMGPRKMWRGHWLSSPLHSQFRFKLSTDHMGRPIRRLFFIIPVSFRMIRNGYWNRHRWPQPWQPQVATWAYIQSQSAVEKRRIMYLAMTNRS